MIELNWRTIDSEIGLTLYAMREGFASGFEAVFGNHREAWKRKYRAQRMLLRAARYREARMKARA